MRATFATAFAITIALLAAPRSAPAGDDKTPVRIVNESGTTFTYACDRADRVIVNGASNVITLTGTCSKVQVNGASNTIQADGVGKLAVTGAGNKVTYKRGAGTARPKIANVGVGNTIQQAK
jgi:hypothetical protein